jgi:hypothetical protein
MSLKALYQPGEIEKRGHCGRDRMAVGFTTTYAISACHHWSCEIESRSGDVCSIQQYVIKVCQWQVGSFLRTFRFPQQQNWPPRYNWHIVESGVKHHNPNPNHKKKKTRVGFYGMYLSNYRQDILVLLSGNNEHINIMARYWQE